MEAGDGLSEAANESLSPSAFGEGLAAVKFADSSKWGYIDTSGAVVMQRAVFAV